MSKTTSYKLTVKACYLGTICQATIVNLTAILFTALAADFNLSYTQLGALVLVNFITQVAVALIFGSIVDRLGFRRFLVGGHITATIGMAWFAVTPWLPFNAYAMLMIGTLMFGVAGGFLELLLSPTLNAIPSDEKSSAMSIMHAFFCFGHAGVAVFTTLFLFIFGRDAWPYVMLIWLLIPLTNAVLFAKCPIAPTVPEESQSSVKDALKTPLFILLVIMILFAGASELAFSQWTSAFMEEAMGLPKIIGDTAGVATFALAMAFGRVAYGVLKKRGMIWLPSQARLMLMGSILSVFSYVIMAVTYNPVLGFIACIMCGVGVSLLWPGTLSLSVKAFPLAGTWMFAIMAAAGSGGASAGPSLFGVIGDAAGLRVGFVVTAVFPLGSLLCLGLYQRLSARKVD